MASRLPSEAVPIQALTPFAAKTSPRCFLTASSLYSVLTCDLVNGTHIAADATSFLEKRRRGLVRFANALVQHPVLNQEQLVVMFLNSPNCK